MAPTIDIDEYRSQGFTILRAVYGEQELESLASACDDMLKLAAGFKDNTHLGNTYFEMLRPCDPFDADARIIPIIRGKLRRVTYAYDCHPTFDQLRCHPALVSALRPHLGDDIVQIVNQVNFNPPFQGTGWGWHQDYRFRREGLDDARVNFVQTVTAIDACNAGNGGLSVVPKSDELGGLKLDLAGEQAIEQFDVSKAMTPELNPGDVLLFNPYVIHGSRANRSNAERRVFINGYARRAACTHGKLVMSQGKIVPSDVAAMEYEQDPEIVQKAAKY